MTPVSQRNRRIVFQRGTATAGGLGTEPAHNWDDYCLGWARVLFGSGQERRQAAADGATMTATFRVPSNSDTRSVTERDRIWFDERAWDIASIATIGLNDEIDFTATASKG